MAELVGVVASGISIGTLAAQIAASLTKLKSYWDQIQEAPEDISSLVEEIEDLYLLLADIEEDQRRNPTSSLLLDGTSASRCLDHCKRGADRLSKLTEELALDIQHSSQVRRKWAAAKVVLKNDKLNKYKAKLERTIRLLSLSHQCYTRALLQSQPDIIISKLREINSKSELHSEETITPQIPSSVTISSPTESSTCNKSKSCSYQDLFTSGFWTPFGSFQYEKSIKNQFTASQTNDTYQKQQDTRYLLRAKLRGPVSFLNRLWEIQGLNARSGWIFTIRSFNVVPYNSLIAEYVWAGNMKGIKELFREQKASPYDLVLSSPSGDYEETLLHIAAFRGDVKLCRFLIDQGADVDANAGSDLPIDSAIIGAYNLQWSNNAHAIDMFRLLLQSGSPSPRCLGHYSGTVEGFQVLIQYMDLPYYQLPNEERIRIVLALTGHPTTNKPNLIQAALSQGPLDYHLVSTTNRDNITLLHAIAQSIGRLVAFRFFAHRQQGRLTRVRLIEYLDYQSDLQGWRNLLKDVIRQGADLHVVSCSGRTPLLSLFEGLFEDCSKYGNKYLKTLLQMWLEDLREVGVDLAIYGEAEKTLLEQGLLNQDIRGLYWDEPFSCRQIQWHIINFACGKSPSHWRVWASDIDDQAAGDFWHMIDRSRKEMPGAWTEDDNIIASMTHGWYDYLVVDNK